MTTKKNNFEWLFSIVGVGVMFVILVAVYVLSHVAAIRADMTAEKLYTLSEGTRNILKKLDTPVQIRFYCTQGKDMPVQLKTYAQRVEDLLGEYNKASGGKIIVKKFDPQPDSDAEEKASMDNVEGQQTNLGDKLYMGLAISMLDSKVAVPFLDPNRERLLEYDITRAIANVTTTTKQVIGVMSALPVMGEFNPMMMRMGGGRQDPWVFVTELKRDFTVKDVPMTADKVDDDINLLIVVHPKAITDKAQFAIDQFVLRGGKLIAFLDPLSYVDSRSNPQQNPLQAAAAGGSNLDKLTKAWGIEFTGDKVVADMEFQDKQSRHPAALKLTSKGVNTNDPVTSQIDNLFIVFSGAFSGTPAEGLKQTVLMHSSSESQLIEKFMAQISGEQISKDFVSSGKEQALAIRLEGKFKTAFPDGKPKDSAPKEDADKKDEKPDATPALKVSAKESAVILVGDSDMLYDQIVARIQEVFGQKMIFPMNGNLNFLQSMVEQLGGDINLIKVRSRGTLLRPFDRVREMQTKAEDKYRARIKDLEKSLSDAQSKLNEMQKSKEGGQRFILSAEQQAEITKFQQKQAEVKKELKDVRKHLRQEIDSLENRLKWANIAGMPVLVTLFGLSMAVLKRRKTAAK